MLVTCFLCTCKLLHLCLSALYLLLYLVLCCFFFFLPQLSLTLLLLSLCLSLSLCTVCVSLPLPPLFLVPCYSIFGIYLSYIISAALLCVASPLPPVRSPSCSLSPSFSLSFPDIDLHSSHKAELPVALQWAQLSLLLLAVCKCACREKKLLPVPYISVSLQS